MSVRVRVQPSAAVAAAAVCCRTHRRRRTQFQDSVAVSSVLCVISLRSAHTSLPASQTAAVHPGLHIPAPTSNPPDKRPTRWTSFWGALGSVGGALGAWGREQLPASSSRGHRAQVCGIPNQSEIGASLASPRSAMSPRWSDMREPVKNGRMWSRAVGRLGEGWGLVQSKAHDSTGDQNRLKRAAKSRQAIPCNKPRELLPWPWKPVQLNLSSPATILSLSHAQPRHSLALHHHPSIHPSTDTQLRRYTAHKTQHMLPSPHMTGTLPAARCGPAMQQRLCGMGFWKKVGHNRRAADVASNGHGMGWHGPHMASGRRGS